MQIIKIPRNWYKNVSVPGVFYVKQNNRPCNIINKLGSCSNDVQGHNQGKAISLLFLNYTLWSINIQYMEIGLFTYCGDKLGTNCIRLCGFCEFMHHCKNQNPL